MKKTIIILLLIALPIIIFGQVGNSLKVFDEDAEFIKANREIVQFAKRDWNINEYLNTVYSFRANKNLYLLSYEDCDNCNRLLTTNDNEIIRNLYLYKLDEYTLTWRIASDIIKIDYRRFNDEDKQEYGYYYRYCNHDLSGAVRTKDGVNQGSVKILENGNVEMIIIYFKREYNDEKSRDYFQWMKVTLIPTTDNNYIVKR